MQNNRSKLTGIAYAILTAIIYAVYLPASRAVYHAGGNDIFILIVTAWARALAMAAYCLRTHKPLFQTPQHKAQAVVGGVFQALTMIGVAMSLVYMQGPLVSIIVYTYALMLLIFTTMSGEAKLTPATLLSTLTALAGLTLVLDLWNGPWAANSPGIGFACLAAVSTACRMYVFGKQTLDRHATVVGAESLLVTACLISLLLFFKAPHSPTSMTGFCWTLVCVLSMVSGSFTMFHGISLLGAFRWGLFSKIEPIFIAIFSVWFLGEWLHWWQYLGIMIVIGSLLVFQIFEQRQRRFTSRL